MVAAQHSGTPEEFVQAVAKRSSQTQAHILPPGQPLTIGRVAVR